MKNLKNVVKVATNHYHAYLEFNEKGINFMAQRGLVWDNERDGENLTLRTHPVVVECVETLGKSAYDKYQYIVVEEIPDEYDWKMEYYDDYYYERIVLVPRKEVLDKFVQTGDTEGLVAYLRGAKYSINE